MASGKSHRLSGLGYPSCFPAQLGVKATQGVVLYDPECLGLVGTQSVWEGGVGSPFFLQQSWLLSGRVQKGSSCQTLCSLPQVGMVLGSDSYVCPPRSGDTAHESPYTFPMPSAARQLAVLLAGMPASGTKTPCLLLLHV